MRILFLDIDGVLNSTRTAIANRGYPHDFSPECRPMFDEVAVSLIRGLCAAGDVKVCVSSAWRIGRTHEEIGRGLDLPTIGMTPSLPGCRGLEIGAWLREHPEVTHYAIVDDDADMLPEQESCFVKTDGHEGLTYAAFKELCALFAVNPYETAPERSRIAQSVKLDWGDAPHPSKSKGETE